MKTCKHVDYIYIYMISPQGKWDNPLGLYNSILCFCTIMQFPNRTFLRKYSHMMYNCIKIKPQREKGRKIFIEG